MVLVSTADHGLPGIGQKPIQAELDVAGIRHVENEGAHTSDTMNRSYHEPRPLQLLRWIPLSPSTRPVWAPNGNPDEPRVQP